MKKSKMMKKSPKALKGALKQADTMSDKKTMGNPGGGKSAMKAREKRLSKVAM